MVTPFVAPPPPPPLPISKKNILQTTQTNSGQLPMPIHTALARRRISIPSDGKSIGALNSSLAPRSLSPSPPPIPPRPSQLSRLNLLSFDMQPDLDDIPLSSASQFSALSDMQSSDFDSAPARSNSDMSMASELPAIPFLVITPPEAINAEEISRPAPFKPDILSLPSLRPKLPIRKYPDTPTIINGVPHHLSNLDAPASAPHFQNSATEVQAPPTPPPPLHPCRRLSPAPSFITLSTPSSTLRHRRAQSSVSSRGSNVPPSRPTILDHVRTGSGASVLTLKDENLTDEDLHRMYDAEEVERYLQLFASRVNEVVAHPDLADTDVPIPTQLPPNLQNPSTPFESIAALIYPYAPQRLPLPTNRQFKLSRAANSAQRLYLALYAAYVPPIVHLAQLSAWKDPKRSATWCAMYWIAWARGLLTPLITGLVFYAMVTGGNVTKEEIRRRREAAREAEVVGKAIQGGIPGVGVSGNLGIWDVVKLVRDVGKKKQKKAKTVIDEITKDGEGNNVAETEVEIDELEDWKCMLLDQMDEVADLHERVKKCVHEYHLCVPDNELQRITSIFLHRRPALIPKYTIIFAVLFLGTLFIQNTSQVITFMIGIFFWFALPIAKHLPNPPPAFGDAPTDAEVAMDLIAQRVARGERVVPERISRRKGNKDNTKSSPNTSNLNGRDISVIRSLSQKSSLSGTHEDSGEEAPLVVPAREREPSAREDRLRKGAGLVLNWLEKTKKLLDQIRGVEGEGSIYVASERIFPAWHRSGLGVLTVSSTILTFNPHFAPSALTAPSLAQKAIQFNIEHLRSVKKVSPSGLVMQYEKGSEVVEERFVLVGERDEVFATLVGCGDGKWKRV